MGGKAELELAPRGPDKAEKAEALFHRLENNVYIKLSKGEIRSYGCDRWRKTLRRIKWKKEFGWSIGASLAEK